MKYLLDIVYSLALLGYLPKACYKRFAQNRYKSGFKQRFGYIDFKRTKSKCIWLHAVSMGEVNATRTLVEAVTKSIPDAEIVLTTTTDTGFERAKALYGQQMSIFYFPFDFSAVMKRAFDNIMPDLCILVELEIWPNFVSQANERAIPVMVFNGRLSDKSFPRYKLIKPLAAWMFSKVNIFLVQTREYAERFIALGVAADKIRVTGSVKYDTAALGDNIAGTEQLAQALNLSSDAELLVAGGTGPGEEEIIIDVFKRLVQEDKKLRLAIVPRKPERFDEVASIIEHSGLPLVRYSKIKSTPDIEPPSEQTVILGDTMGDLRKFYALADLVFVGRSLSPMGGSDMMESAAMGRFTVFGKHTYNFKQTVEALLAGDGAVEVADGSELYSVFNKALTDKQYRNGIAQRGKQIIKDNQGATEKSLAAVLELIKITNNKNGK